MITLYITNNQVSKYTGDCLITRTIERNLFDITLLTATGTAFPMTGILTWEIGITEDFKRRTPILAGSSTITATQNVLSVSLNAHTIQMRAFLEGKRGAPLYATLRGFNGASEAVCALVFPVMAYNVGYELDDPTAQAVDELFYTKAETDAKLADIGTALDIPKDISDLTDTNGLLFSGDYDDLQNKPTIPTDISQLDDSTARMITSAERAKVATIQNETLAALSGASVSIAPWTQSRWTATGACTLTATGWAASGHQLSYILITLSAGATIAVSGATVEEDDAISGAGQYTVYLINQNGTVYFRLASYTEAV